MRTHNCFITFGAIAVLVGGIAVAVGLTRWRKPSVLTTTPALSVMEESETSPLVESWTTQLGGNRRFAIGVARAPENAPAFASLAQGSGVPALLVAASLYALEAAHAARPQEARRLFSGSACGRALGVKTAKRIEVEQYRFGRVESHDPGVTRRVSVSELVHVAQGIPQS
jgi:hypothetical protein